MSKIDERIEALEAKLEQLKVQHQRKEIRARGEELRRNILVGAIVPAKAEQGDLVESVLRGWLDVALTRADDRALCELSAKP